MASVRVYQTRTGERRYLVRWRQASGKQCSRGGFQRRRDADRYKTDVERRRAMGVLYEAAPETFGDYLDAWLERHRLRVEASSHRRRVEAVRNLPAALRDLAIPQLGVADVEDPMSVLAARSPRQAQIALATVKLALRDAMRRRQTVDPAVLEIPAPKARERAARFLTWPEVERLASWMPDQDGRMVRFAVLTGLRQGELFRLRWSDVNWETPMVSIQRSKTAAARRVVDLSSMAVDILREQALMEGEDVKGSLPGSRGSETVRKAVFASPSVSARATTSGRNPGRSGALIFPAAGGGQRNANNFMARVFRPAVHQAGLAPLRFHDLRHSFASLMFKAGADPKTVADLMGHADGGVLVFRRYSHLYPGSGRAAVVKLDQLLVGDGE